MKGRRAYFCADACDKAWKLRHDWAALQHHILNRDAHAGVGCGVRGSYAARVGSTRYNLEVDHIVEIMDGGVEFDPANLQTLCRDCHKAKTAASWKARVVQIHRVDGAPQGRLL